MKKLTKKQWLKIATFLRWTGDCIVAREEKRRGSKSWRFYDNLVKEHAQHLIDYLFKMLER